MTEARIRPINVGIIGTGFIARQFAHELLRRSRFGLASVLTRRDPEACGDFPASDRLTNSLDQLVADSDVVVECTGDPIYATETIDQVLASGTPVVTMNAEFHVTVGSNFVDEGLLSEAEGDQPGSLAALHEEAIATGFTPLAYGNMKTFLDENPSPEQMEYWSRKQGYSLNMVTAFTDGTKVNIEQCLVANGLGAGIAREGLLGIRTPDLREGAEEMAKTAEALGYPISDYVLDSAMIHGVFVVARHAREQAPALANLKMGSGPNYLLTKPYCLAHLEIFKTVERMVEGSSPLLTNSKTPRISVASMAKRPLKAGDRIDVGYGSFDLRGICVDIADRPGHIPIGLARNMHLTRNVEPGELLSFEDVDLEPNRALDIWQSIERRVIDLAAKNGAALRKVPA